MTSIACSRMILAMALVMSISMVAAAAPVNVQLRSGRTFTAEIDAATDEDLLWLRFTASTTMVLRPVEWQAVVAAQYEGQQYSADDFKALATNIASERPRQFIAEELQTEGHHTELPSWNVNTGADAEFFSAFTGHSSMARQVRALRIEAVLDNSDADAEMDGVTVHFSAVDELGRPVAVDGTISASLIGEHRGSFGVAASHRELGSGIHRVAAWESTSGNFVRVPLTQSGDFEQHIRRLGQVQARLTVPGQGTFEATTYVRVRPFTPFRHATTRAF